MKMSTKWRVSYVSNKFGFPVIVEQLKLVNDTMKVLR